VALTQQVTAEDRGANQERLAKAFGRAPEAEAFSNFGVVKGPRISRGFYKARTGKQRIANFVVSKGISTESRAV